MMDKKDYFIVLILWLSAVYLWSLPIQNNPLPYGEVDAAAHYGIGAYMAYEDRSILALPNFLYRYRLDNQLKHWTLWYPPQFHSNLAIMDVLDSNNSKLAYMFLALISTSFVLTTYLLIRTLYGVLAGALSSFLMIFSVRNYIGYLWGQWPQVVVLAVIPLILYLYYKYLNSFLEKGRPKSLYIYMVAMLIACQFLIHPFGIFHSFAALFVYTAFFFIKQKKFYFKIKHIIAFILIFFAVTVGFAPMQFASVVLTLTGGNAGTGLGIHDPGRLFYWFKAPTGDWGYPPFYFSYTTLYGWFIISLILVGFFILLIRRSPADILLLSWLVSVYILIHMDVIGMGNSIFRSLIAESYIFYSLVAIAIVSLPNILSIIVKPLKQYNKAMKYAFVLLFVLFILSTSAKSTYMQLNGAYGGLGRISASQHDAAVWLRENLDENSNITSAGTVSLTKKRWMQTESLRHILDDWENETAYNYFMLDYSDAIAMGDKPTFDGLQQIELKLINSSKFLVYNNENIRVYKLV